MSKDIHRREKTAAHEEFPMSTDTKTAPPGMRLRITMIALFLFLTLPILPLMMGRIPAMRILFPVEMSLRAVPLYLAWQIDKAFYDGGELSGELWPVWVVITGLVYLPLLLLGIWPSIWRSGFGRKALLGYSTAAVLGTVVAAFCVFGHSGAFF